MFNLIFSYQVNNFTYKVKGLKELMLFMEGLGSLWELEYQVYIIYYIIKLLESGTKQKTNN